jgi:tRNA(Glu) U13 pseudouridine synthase TruD
MQKIPAKLKHSPEDFIVEEIGENWTCKISETFDPNTKPKIPNPENSNAIFLWCELEKFDIDHFSSIKIIADFLNISTQAIGYAGTKDKVAHTSQRISLESPNTEKLQNFYHENIILKNFRWNKRKIKIGYLDANHFKITLRDIDKKDAIKITSQIRKTSFFPNLFGPQRFGNNNSNVKIGKEIIKRNFDKAFQLIKEDNPRLFANNIKQIPRKILLMYVSSVQSIIFNDIVTKALEEGLNLEEKGQQSGMLIGYKTRFSKGRLGQIEQEVLAKHNLTLEDFDIQEIPFLRMKGSFRKAITKIENLNIETDDDEKFSGSKKIILEFTLPSGVYATTFLENFFTFN